MVPRHNVGCLFCKTRLWRRRIGECRPVKKTCYASSATWDVASSSCPPRWRPSTRGGPFRNARSPLWARVTAQTPNLVRLQLFSQPNSFKWISIRFKDYRKQDKLWSTLSVKPLATGLFQSASPCLKRQVFFTYWQVSWRFKWRHSSYEI